jgi:mono/diheme cytochrome c family protein
MGMRRLLALAGALIAISAPAAHAQAGGDLQAQCSSCHALAKPQDPTLDRLWTRKGPDLWYAGDKFNRDWLVSWLQKPTPIRPGGVLWFKHAKPGDPRDTLDAASVPAHPSVDAATAAKLADALMQLKGEGLTSGPFSSEGANMMMAKLAFSKLRGCSSCHQDAPGQGGLSGPQLYDAGQRLKPEYIYAYTKDPQKFDRFIWMPRMPLSEPDLKNLTAYLVSVGKGAQ